MPEVTYRADIYALACVLFECLTGSPPYRADSAGVLVSAHMMDPIPAASEQRPGVPNAFDAVIARGMAKKPEDRYASAGDLALAANEALSNPDQDRAATILRRSQEAALPTADHPGARAHTVPAPQQAFGSAFNTPRHRRSIHRLAPVRVRYRRRAPRRGPPPAVRSRRPANPRRITKAATPTGAPRRSSPAQHPGVTRRPESAAVSGPSSWPSPWCSLSSRAGWASGW